MQETSKNSTELRIKAIKRAKIESDSVLASAGYKA